MNNLLINNQQNIIQQNQFNTELFKRFIAYSDVKETTLKGYTVCIRQFTRWLQENNITQPQREDIKAYKKHLNEQGFTSGTKAQYLRSVKHFFRWTASEGYYPNVADNIKAAKVKHDNTKKSAFEESDIQAILQSIDRSTEAGKRNYAMILLSVTGGLRIIEMQRANIQDMQTIKNNKILYIQGKGHDSKDDYIKIIPEVAEAIEDYLKERPTAKKEDPLFAGTGNRAKGGRLTEPSISRIIKTVFRNAGYDCNKLTAHSLRHTSNTLLFKTGADLFTVQQHARHSDPKTTEIYIHVMNKENDRSEQAIYNQIFKPNQRDIPTEAFELMKELTEEEQQKVLDYIMDIAGIGIKKAM